MKAIIKVIAPVSTPWSDGVRVCLLGDCTDLFTLQSELAEIKNMVNADVNKAGMALKDVKITIELERE